jgi:hypothetical protein
MVQKLVAEKGILSSQSTEPEKLLPSESVKQFYVRI